MQQLLNRHEAAAELGVSVATIDRLRKSGQLTFIQRTANGNVRFTRDALAEYIARITRPAQPLKAVRETYRKRRV